MSELLEVFRREAEKFREFRGAMRGLRREVDRAWGLEAEISELMKRAREDEMRPLWHALLEIMTGEDPSGRPRIEVEKRLRDRVIEGPNPLDILRGMRKRAALLREAIGLAEGLEIPEPPPTTFSRDLDLEAELPLEEGLRRVRVRVVRIWLKENLPSVTSLDRGVVWVEFELNGERRRRKIEESSDLPFLLPVHREVMELLREATRRQEEYVRELEAFRRQFSSQHSRKILMASL
jgi:hypothetical protein